MTALRRACRFGTACALAAGLAVACAVPAGAQVALRLVVTGLSQPVAFIQDPTNPSVQFIVQKGGRIRVLSGGVLLPTDFLDLSGVVLNEGERGLLGLAFAPDYATSRRFYVNFVNLQSHTVVARFTRSAGNPLVADPASRFDLRWPGGQRYITQLFTNHKGGTLRFGPDGYLYIGMGDGGSGNDPTNAAQNPSSLLGKMLRVDVSVNDADPAGYRIPLDNPFVDGSPIAALGEIWAFGLRNPWKFSFDDAAGGTGGMFIGDVGQSAREEIDFEPAGAGGRNYGWRLREGTIAGGALPVLPAAYLPLTDPIFDYPRTVGQSVTGGYVYRGTQLDPSYQGRYVFGDFVAGRIMSLGLSYPGGEGLAGDMEDHTEELGGASEIGLVSSIDRDAAGEVYVVDFRGSIRRLEPGVRLILGTTGSGSVVRTPGGACTGTCIRSYLPGTSVTMTAAPAAGSAFGGWSGLPDCTDGRVTMDDGRICLATFLPVLAVKPPGLRLDLNGDGRGDVFTYDAATGAWASQLSGAAGIVGASTGSWIANWTIRPGDFNADGLTDLFLYNATSGQWFKALRTTSGQFAYSNGSWRSGWDVTVLDLSGDGRADVLLYDAATGQWFTCLTTPAGGFAYATGQWAPGFEVHRAELDGNARADAFLYNAASGDWLRAVSNGAGGFSTVPGAWRAGWTVGIGDFNADRRSDVFLYDPATGLWFLCTNVGAGFTYATSTWNPGWTMRVADFDANGRSDVFLYNAATGVWFQCLTTSAGFAYYTGQWPAGREPWLSDFNGDRRADVLLYHAAAGAWSRAQTTGIGTFQVTSGVWEPNLTIVVE